MTWEEFKRAVEAAGVVDADRIAYIDWSGYHGEQVGAFRTGPLDSTEYVAIDDDGRSRVEKVTA